MQTQIIQSTGIVIDKFYIPPFAVNNGEIVVIQLPEGQYFSELLFKLVDLLTGKDSVSNVEIKSSLKFVEHIKAAGWRNRFFPMTVAKYIKKYGNPLSHLPEKIYDQKGISAQTKIDWLGGKQRKLLSLLITFSWSDKIIFDLAGVGPDGGIEAYKLVKNQIGTTGAAILIDQYDEFRNDCSLLIKYELLP